MSGQFVAVHHAVEATRRQFEPGQPPKPPRRRHAVVRPAAARALRTLADRLEPAPRPRRA